jgi:hypothetical protein
MQKTKVQQLGSGFRHKRKISKKKGKMPTVTPNKSNPKHQNHEENEIGNK